jgi:hypothetical protein
LDVQPEGIPAAEEIFPSAEIAKLVEMCGRCMAETGTCHPLLQESIAADPHPGLAKAALAVHGNSALRRKSHHHA